MKTKFYIITFIGLLFYCCQQKDSIDSNENIDLDSVEISGIDNEMLREWFSLNRHSDSIVASARLIIKERRDEVEFHPQDEREYITTCINEAQQHLDELKRKVKYIREFAVQIKKYDPEVQYKIDSLKEDYIQEELKLNESLSHLY
ncbi:hypothetical protein [Flavobacterium humidisoli]|uniref:Uncharacterized protein n=1 Tax=Flavobacterium humidisoli TaxID=2937442 RepID=A0ABY4LMT7_9FLAO|nr:hypothetical protein [Flavobacterium humidisoli]UPZ14421.1 hypothetical protein M0M44_16830 [Flavobacterium humidisoli]